MTLIVGIVAKDAIVMASESQTTAGDVKLFGAQKLQALKFGNQEVLVGVRGIVTSGLQVVRFMQEMASGKDIESNSTVTDVTKEAMIKFRGETTVFYTQQRSMEELDLHFKSPDHSFDLMIAHWHGETPCLYTVSVASGDPEPHSSFAAIGSAANLANSTLARRSLNGIGWKSALLVAIDAVERAMGSGGDLYCGGPVNAAIVKRHRKDARFLDDELTAQLAEKLLALDKASENKFITEMGTIASEFANDLESFSN